MSRLTLTGVTVGGRDRVRLDGVSLDLAPGELVLVVGPNGAGKSTLLGVIAGIVKPREGSVRVGERALGALGPRERAARVAWLPQEPRLEEGLTAEEVVAAARFRFREPARVALSEARSWLTKLGVGDLAGRTMDALSGGESQRVRLASLGAQEADWWLLDEPGNHLDPGVRLDLLALVKARAAEGGGVVLVTHDLALLGPAPDAKVVVLVTGRVAHVGRADNPGLPDVLGPALGVRLTRVPVDGGQGMVVAGRAP